MTPRKPIWTEGLFVTEHHLQQQDRYHEQLLDERLEFSGRPNWGILESVIDLESLGRGQVALERLRAVMPDGTSIDVGAGAGPLPPAREIGPRFGPSVTSLAVYVAVAHESPGRGNLGQDGAASGRFSRESTIVADFNAGGREHEFSWARPHVRLILGDEPKEGVATIQVAELLRSQTGAFLLRDTFVPSVAQISASDFLVDGLRRVANAVSTRARAVSQTRRQRGDARIEFDAGDVSKMLLLATLNRAIPTFSHFLNTPSAHPEQLYVEVASLAGELCTFVPNVDPSSFSQYNYMALGDTFEPLFARALALINTTVDERFVEIPLKRREDGMYLGKIEDANVLRYEFFIAARGTLSEAEMHQQLPKLSKIASWGQIGSLLNSAVNGARVQLEFRPSSALPIRPGISFFRIQRTPEYWPDIQGTGTIAIYQPLPAEAVELSLYAVDPEKL